MRGNFAADSDRQSVAHQAWCTITVEQIVFKLGRNVMRWRTQPGQMDGGMHRCAKPAAWYYTPASAHAGKNHALEIGK